MSRGAPNVAVAGMAWTTALGDELDAVWQRLRAGESGLAHIPHPGRLRNDLAAAAASVPLDLPPGERLARMAVATARKALAAPGVQAASPDALLVIGTSFGSYIEDDPPEPSAHAWADRVACALGLSRKPLVVSTACSAGSDAILVGAELVRSGVEPCCICGGVDVLTSSKRLAHSALGTMSPTMLRAFDVRHDGTLLGEGAAFMVLERADGRGKPLAFCRGAGSASDATGMTAPDTSGTAVCFAMARSAADAGLELDQIGIINTHGSGTPLNDLTEREALRAVFGRAAKPVVFATKGNFGHSLGATGAIEAVALVLALQRGEVPPVVGLEQPDPEFPLPLPMRETMPVPARFGLSLTLGFGGFDTSLLFEAPA